MSKRVDEILEQRKKMADGGESSLMSQAGDVLKAGALKIAQRQANLLGLGDVAPTNPDAIQPITSPIDVLAGMAGAQLGTQIAPVIEGVAGNEMGAIGRDIKAPFGKVTVQELPKEAIGKVTQAEPGPLTGGKSYFNQNPATGKTILQEAAEKQNQAPATTFAEKIRRQYADGGDVTQGDLASYGISQDPNAAPKQEVVQQPDAINVYNPTGELVSIPSHQQADALSSGYTIPTPQQLDQHFAEQKYAGVGQQALAGLEGVGQGLAGPVATAAELAAGVPREDILGREKAYPGTSGIGETAGLVGGMFTGTGEAHVLGMLGEAGVKAAMKHEAATAVEKIGSTAVRGMIENAVAQSGNEVSKMILQDPDQSAQTALVDIGLSGLLGGGIGGSVGAAGELWNATAGHKVGKFLNAMSTHAGGIENVVSSDINKAITDSGLTIEPEIRAALSDDPHALQAFSTLNQSDTTASGKKLQQTVKDFKNNIGEGLAAAFGHTGESVKDLPEVNKYEWGKKLGHTLSDEYKAQVDPLQVEFETLKNKYQNEAIVPSISTASGTSPAIKVPGTVDVAAAQIARLADEQAWTHSPEIMKEVTNLLDNLPKLKTIKDIGNLATAVSNNTASTLPFGQQTPLSRAGGMLKNILREAESDAAMARLGEDKGPELVNRYRNARAAYAAQSDLKEALDSRLGTRSSTTGFGKALKEMANTDGEGVIRRLSGKNDADLLATLEKNYPKTAEMLKQYHKASILEQAVNKAKPDEVMAAGTLLKQVNALDPNLRNFALDSAAQGKINALGTLLDKVNQVPNHNFSNTGRTVDKLMQHVPGTAAGMAALLTGHSLGSALMVGPLVKLISKDAPDAVRLALLKFLGSGKEISAPAFKSAVDYIQATVKGENAINRSVRNLFVPGREMLPVALLPTPKERDKLDKHLQQIQIDPSRLATTGGDTSHYLPEHGGAMAQTTANAANVLNSLRPNTTKASPLDSKPVLNTSQTSEYTRALDIAQQPLLVLQKIQKGTLVPQDVVLLQKLYPALYTKLSSSLMAQMTDNMAKGRTVPYATRIGLSMFMAQPLDSTMQPASIMAAQPQSNAPQMPQQGSQRPPSASSMKGMAKLPTAYKTPGQAREAEKSSGK